MRPPIEPPNSFNNDNIIRLKVRESLDDHPKESFGDYSNEYLSAFIFYYSKASIFPKF